MDCLAAFDAIDRKHKYVSGTLAFEPSDKPTDAQLQKIVDSFRKTFMGGLELGVNFVDFWNIHEGKGRIDLNYVIPMVELTTGRRVNPFPPSQAKEDFKDAFDAYINHQMGYNQVVPDPIKASESQFELNVLPKSSSKTAEEFKKNKPTKDEISGCVAHQIINGKIQSRQELFNLLGNFGEITRINNKFISIKPYGNEKVFRLKGPVYEHGADFQKIKTDHLTKNSPNKLQLDDNEFQKVRDTLSRLAKSRREFHESLISKLVGIANKSRVYGSKKKKVANATRSVNSKARQSVKVDQPKSQAVNNKPVEQSTKITAPKTDVQPVSKSNDKESSNHSDESSSSSPIILGGSDSGGSVGSLSADLNKVLSEIANTRDSKKLAELEAKAAGIRAKLESASMAERIRQTREALNQSDQFNRKKLKK